MFLNISQNSQENTCASLFFNKVAGNFIKKETLVQVFSCEFSKIFKNTFFTEHLRATASKYRSVKRNSHNFKESSALNPFMYNDEK